MSFRPLLAIALAAAAFATPAHAATGAAGHPPCAFHPICDRLGEIGHVRVHGVCDTVEDIAPWLVYCH